ncbi:MAG: phage tail tip lysozyme [Bacillota bacterium]|nr:phage tail tip lysozyme [Bacillota bacterium]
MKKFILCITLSIMMVLSLIPQVTFAAETDVEAASNGVITGFAEMETSDYYYEGNPAEDELTLNLPDTLSVYVDGSSTATEIPVSWEAIEDYDNTDFYFYSMKPVWGGDYTLSPELSEIMDVPWITVYKQEPENEEIEPMLTEEEIEPVYTEEEGPVDPENYEEGSIEAFANTVKSIFVEEVYAATVAENTAAIYNYLTQRMGLNTAAACGVMTNINAESGMASNNLQNTYNKSIGLSDSEYTSRVDSGKYTKFTSDSAGYGLCQWTSSGRKSNLLSYAKSQNKSIGDLTMQLEFFNKELQSSYQSVYTTLKSVPNNATGAYIAAAEMCMCYEIPANTVATAASRGKTCLSNYYKTYSGTSASATGTSFISLCGYTYPTAVKNGKGMDVKGYAISNYNVTSITGKIINSSGSAVYSKTISTSSTATKLSQLDSYMKFSKLSNGTYTYQVTAKDSSGKSVTVSHKFKVSSSGSTTKTLGFASIGGSTQAAQPAEEVSEPATDNSGASSTQTDTSATAKKAYSGTYPKIPKRGYFRKGDKGTQVKNLQKLLNWCGCPVSTGGKYGPATIKAVKKLQKKLGIKQDGKFGNKTLKKVKALRM